MNATQALAAYIQAAPPFNWLTHNCVHFAGGWCAPGALADLAHAVMPAHPLQVPVALRLLGARSLKQAVTARVGPLLLNPQLAQAGDLVLRERTLGICIGRCFVAQLAEGGVVMLPMAEAHAAWRRVTHPVPA